MSDVTLRPDDTSTIALLLARGYLRYRRSRLPESAHNPLALPSEQSVHVTVVNAQETEENE